MTLTRRQAARLISAGALVAAAPPKIPGTPDPSPEVTVFEAAKIITMERSRPSARFVATQGGLILAVSQTLAELAPWTDGRRVTLNRQFADKILLPGLIDPHVHPVQAAVMLNLPFIAPDDWELPTGHFPGSRTPHAWRARLKELLAASADTPFICWGYHELFHGALDRAELDRLAPDRPVIIWQRSFHEVIVNSAALNAWGLGTPQAFAAAVAQLQADPAHADFARGLLSETALSVALAKLRPIIFAPERMTRGMSLMQQMLRARGVTTVSDMATGIFAGFEAEAALIKAAFSGAQSAARVMLMPFAAQMPDATLPEAWLEAARARFEGPNVGLDRRVKLFADGAFFAQNMRMGPPGYTDGHVGKWLTEPPVLKAQMDRFWAAGFSLHIHVNGDEGLDVVLTHLASLPPRASQSVTLEHLGYATEAQNRRIAQLGLMVSAQPNYIRVLGDAYGTHGLGADRAAVMNRLGSLEARGVPLGLHSDFNMAPIDPLYLAWIAANRITIDGRVKAPEERLSLDKALRAITIEAAEVIGMDAKIGSIAPGKRADFAVLDRDPYQAGAAALRDLRVAGVIFEGRVAR